MDMVVLIGFDNNWKVSCDSNISISKNACPYQRIQVFLETIFKFSFFSVSKPISYTSHSIESCMKDVITCKALQKAHCRSSQKQ